MLPAFAIAAAVVAGFVVECGGKGGERVRFEKPGGRGDGVLLV